MHLDEKIYCITHLQSITMLIALIPTLLQPSFCMYIREGKSPDDKKTLHFVLNFLQISLFLCPFPELMPELYKTTAFHHAPLQCKTTQWNNLLYFTAISCYASIGSMKFSGNPHSYCCCT
jgi:hypothetical protein